ncbi:hypothetical protein L2E82_32260 [Cichorium intybus]|uniref:Uncharacterized protein n=1 Tax=Cichorium intybus TaxID=13427 RepID=A0ACB9BH38_CICIN|nr:hypothetical protein L2E82_32260 [Cichorium intybus]
MMEKKSIPRSHSPLGFFGIIRESYKTTSRNEHLVFPMLLLVFFSFSQLDFTMLAPVAEDLKLQLAKHPNMFHNFITYNIDQTTYSGALNDVREILAVQLLITAISSIVTLVVLVATVSSSYEAYTAKALCLKDMFLKLRKSWKRLLETSFYIVLLTLGIVFLYLTSIGITAILAVNSWALFLFGAITLSIPVCYFYVSALWIVSMVVSVLEEGFGGLKAIGRAAELMKGKRLHASLMMLLIDVAYVVVHLMASGVTSYSLLAIAISFRKVLFCWLKLFMFVVYTVFYHEWKTSHDEKEGKGFYLPIAAGEA